ncbi:MAG: response regulator [Candidatus Saccharibacteria bacterium]|nr:response regulator [Pseudorhodobacter sp.]
MTQSRPQILIVDDEPQILRFLGHSLTAVGYHTTTASTGAEALRQIAARSPDLMILDLGLPDTDGKAVIEAVRQSSNLPIIVLSARDQEMEKIMALDLGADDFVAKPFAIGELLARLRVCLRPVRKAQPETRLRLGTLVIDTAAHRVTHDGVELHLTPKEFDLLCALAEKPGRVLTHRQLLTRVWGPAHVEDVPYLRVFIGQLRQKIEIEAAAPTVILTEPGVGYRGMGAED